MKKFITLIIIILIAGCGDDSNSVTPAEYSYYGNIAYESLSAEEKSNLLDGNKPFKVEQGIYGMIKESDVLILNENEKFYFLISESSVLLNNGQKLFAVYFNTIHDSLLGPLVIIVDPESEKAVGAGLRM
ncbi:MAG: hypothetical protein KJ571_09695 [Bacteroidetes bacterium]|nr:hypothetical protein [Bacteroidota bacterium]